MIDNTVEQLKMHFEAVMDLLGIARTESNVNTPLRMAKMYANELFRNRNGLHIDELDAQMKVFPVEGKTDAVELTVPVSSMCEHHWLPFMGVAKIEYIPDKTIIGLSKIPRVVDYFSQRPQLQERLTQEIGFYLVKVLNPKYLKVKLICEHTCVSIRGAKRPCKTKTRFVFNKEESSNA